MKKHFLVGLWIVFVASIFCLDTGRVFASQIVSNLNISTSYESSTHYFYSGKPVVSGNVSSDARGVIVSFDNLGNGDSYFVSVSQGYPSGRFTTASDCFSSRREASVCLSDISDGTYRVSVEVSVDIYSDPQIYTFPKTFVRTSSMDSVDKSAPNAPTVNSLPAQVDSDVIDISGSAEAGSLVTISGQGQIKTVQLASGQTKFVVTVNLSQNTTNSFSVVSTDASGNVSPATTVSIIEKNSPAAVVSSAQTTSSVGGNQNVSTTTNNGLTSQTPIASIDSKNNTEQAGSVKGVATKKKDSVDQMVLKIFYISIVLLVLTWAMYFWKKRGLVAAVPSRPKS